MSSIQKTLDSLQPYVIGIRYLEGIAVVDAVFKEGWTVPDVERIQKAKGDEGMNYYMVFSEVPGVGLDDLLSYVEATIKLNLEREKKHDLLKAKVKELQEIFKKNSLAKLTKLKFSFSDEDLTPKLSDIDMDVEERKDEETFIEEEVPTPLTPEKPKHVEYLDADKNPIPVSSEDLEAQEEEARAERFRQVQEVNKKKGEVKNIANKKIELPPKKKMESPVPAMAGVYCECGPNEACDKCIESKDL